MRSSLRASASPVEQLSVGQRYAAAPHSPWNPSWSVWTARCCRTKDTIFNCANIILIRPVFHPSLTWLQVCSWTDSGAGVSSPAPAQPGSPPGPCCSERLQRKNRKWGGEDIFLERCGDAKVTYILEMCCFIYINPYSYALKIRFKYIWRVLSYILSWEIVYEILNTSLLKRNQSREMFPVGRNLQLRQSGEEKQIRPKLPQLLIIAR